MKSIKHNSEKCTTSVIKDRSTILDRTINKPRITRKTNNLNKLVRKHSRLLGNNPVNSKTNSTTPSKSLTAETNNAAIEDTEATDVMADTIDNSSSLQLEMAAKFLNKTQTIRFLLESDLLACDVKWTLFLVAALSYRYDMKLMPIPPRYIEEGNSCNINALAAVINDTPKLNMILQNILEKNYEEMDVEVIELLYWVLVEMREMHFLRISSHESENILRELDKNIRLPVYTHVFEVVASKGFHSTEEFRQRISNEIGAECSTSFGFFSAHVDNFYAMLNCGINTESNGASKITLCKDLEACAKLAPICAGWGASECGPMISCTALCEYAVRDNKLPSSNTFEVDANIARIRYLLVCDVRRAQHKKSKRRIFSWFRRYRYCFSLVAYAIILASIGVANCNNCELFGCLVNSKFQSLLDIFKRMIRSD